MEPDRETETTIELSGKAKPEDQPSLFAQRKFQRTVVLSQCAGGKEIPGSLVLVGYSFQNSADEEVRMDASKSRRWYPGMVLSAH